MTKRQTKAPEVSILVCTYNRRNFLEKNLNSIFKQTFQNYEIIIIDDGSSDDTEKFVHSLKDPRIRYFKNEKNMGGKHGDWVHVHRTIYELMHGKYFIYLCDDDYWRTDYVLETLVDKFYKYPNLSLAFGMHCHIFPEENSVFPEECKVPDIKNCYTIKRMFPSGHMKGLEYLAIYSSSPCNKNCLEGASLFSREKMVACGAFKEKLPEKNWQGGYMFKMGVASIGDVFFIDEPYVVATVLDTGQSFQRTHRDHFQDGARAIIQSYQFLKEGSAYKEITKNEQSQIAKLYKMTLINYIKHWVRVQNSFEKGSEYFGCTEAYFEKKVRLRDIFTTFVDSGFFPNFNFFIFLLYQLTNFLRKLLPGQKTFMEIIKKFYRLIKRAHTFKADAMNILCFYIFGIRLFLPRLNKGNKLLNKRNKDVWGVFHVPVWGEYTEIYLSFLQRNLLASSNKEFAKDHNIIIMFSCFKNDKRLIEKDKNYSELKRNYSIIFDLYSNKSLKKIEKHSKNHNFFRENSKYLMLGVMQRHAVAYAKKVGAALIPSHPDIMIEKEFFSKIENIRKKGFEVILTSPFRSDLEKIKNFIEEKKISGSSLSFSGQDIVDLQCKFIHKISIQRLVAPDKEAMSLTAQLIFKEKNALVVKAFTRTPAFISKNLLKVWEKKIYSPIDDNVTFLTTKDVNKIYFIEDASQLGMCELSGPKPEEANWERLGRSLEEVLFEWFSHNPCNLSKKHLFFFNQKIVFQPTQKLPIKFASVDTDALSRRFLASFN